jgi:hypothetical protein
MRLDIRDIRASVNNDEAHDLERFRFHDGGCPRVLQLRTQSCEIKTSSGLAW